MSDNQGFSEGLFWGLVLADAKSHDRPTKVTGKTGV